ncbi:HAD-IA family hydrolase [Lichenicola cladoniae]|uniref:HAD-IA family hydrolase n=1 Tax=Lichenicola cladoniae TaxID=1484109 RepID=A0A6M8HQQ7_9PROT|nr:HAD-IA family hydrolase [Lichenicola cladoniae]NPD68047.1 HAD-IA family hydrolase [Acetobacteraceae bacterium]QKE90626.1 HAD-IA family hydrolase [Lichenicola cladoniae]
MRVQNGHTMDVSAVLFDMDGTLVDSTAAVERVWRRWAARHGLDFPALLAVSHGRRAFDTIARFAPSGVDHAGENRWMLDAEMVEQDGIIPIPGAQRLMASLPPGRVAVVTSAARELALLRLRLAGLMVPSLVIAAEDVTAGKPDPQGYLQAARELGFAPETCLVVEDAPAGLEAGRAAGGRVLALATTLTGAELEAWDWVPDLDAVRLEQPSPNHPLRLRFD